MLLLSPGNQEDDFFNVVEIARISSGGSRREWLGEAVTDDQSRDPSVWIATKYE